MTTYGPINGLWTAGSYDLLTTVLRKEWGCSNPSHSYSSSDSFSLKLQARQVPFGMAKAMVPQSMRIPLGPSAQQPAGIP
mgnify:CR=1 FL=1